MRTVGSSMQDATWVAVAEQMVVESGGIAADGVQRETVSLDDAQARRVETWLKELVLDRQASDFDDAAKTTPGRE
jgi:hypothetical protein